MVFVILLIFTAQLFGYAGVSKNDFHCLIWDIVGPKLMLTYRTSDFIQPISFYDSNGNIQANCTFILKHPACVAYYKPGNITANLHQNEVIFNLTHSDLSSLDGNWSCLQGNKNHTVPVSTANGILDATDIHISGKMVSDNFIQVTCSSCRRPDSVEFLENNSTADSMYYDPANKMCYGQCGSSGTEFIRTFSIASGIKTSFYSCDMRFSDNAKSLRFSKDAKLKVTNREITAFGVITKITKRPETEFNENVSENPDDHETSTKPIESKNHSSSGLVKGIAIGVLLSLVVTIAIVVIYLIKRKMINKRLESDRMEKTRLLGNISEDLAGTVDVGTSTDIPGEIYTTGKQDLVVTADVGPPTDITGEVYTTGKQDLVVTADVGTSTDITGEIYTMAKQDLVGTADVGTLTDITREIYTMAKPISEKTDQVSICKPCSKLNRSILADYWCFECQEPFCANCLDFHKVQTRTEDHQFVEMGQLPDKYTFSAFCGTHKAQLIFFCIDHDCLCCSECLIVNHRACDKVKPLNLASENVQKSENLNTYIDQISDINRSLSFIEENRLLNIEAINCDTARIETEIEEGEIKKSAQLKIDLNNKKNDILSEMNEDISKAKKISDYVHQQKVLLKFFVDFAPEKQIFLLIHLSKQDMVDQEKITEGLIDKSKCLQLQFFNSQTVEIIEQPVKFPDNISRKIRQSQFAVTHKESISCRSLGRVPLNELGPCIISSMAVSANGLLHLCDCHTPRILVSDENGSNTSIIKINYIPWDIAIIQDKNKAALTCMYETYVQFVDTDNHTLLQDIYIDGINEGGISCTDENILVGGANKIHILDMKGDQLKVIENIIDGNAKFRYISNHDGRIVFNAYGSDVVRCVNFDGKVIFRYQSSHFMTAMKILSDKEGHHFVLGRQSNNMIILNKKGQFICTALSESDGLQGPRGMCFNNDYSKLFVYNTTGKGQNVLVFEIRKEMKTADAVV